MPLSAWNDFTAGVKPYGVNYVLIVKYLPQCQKKMSLQNQVLQTIVAVNLSYSQVALPPLWIREPQYILNSQDIKILTTDILQFTWGGSGHPATEIFLRNLKLRECFQINPRS